jgi:hypothetical protein
VGAVFGATANGAPFPDAAGETNELRQNFRIDINPGPTDGMFVFHFPASVASDTAPTPEPPSAVLTAIAVLTGVLFFRNQRSSCLGDDY